jgi:ketopantoate reductase
MDRVRAGTIGILPAGALGVSFFYHLTRQLTEIDGRVFFLERSGSKSAEAIRAKGQIIIEPVAGDSPRPELRRRLEVKNLFRGDLMSAWKRSELPEVLLLCPNPDQLSGVLATVVELLERSYECGELNANGLGLPILILASNGIYYQRLRQLFIERLEESTLLGRLPDLWPEIMPRIIGQLLRGVTIQTGLRDGSGADVIYHPGPIGITRLAGGDATVRERTWRILSERGAWIELAKHSSATRLEFDKAMVNLTANVLGQLYAIDAVGSFRLLRVAEIVTREHEQEIRELTQRVFEVGRAVKAYGADEQFESIFQHALETTHQHDEHVPSSLQWVGLRLRQQKLEPTLTPTETWLLDPLIRYAHASGLDDAANYFEKLRARLVERLALAANRIPRPTPRAAKYVEP